MVKVTGGGRGMRAIAAHLRYIGKNGRLPMEDDQGRVQDGKDAVHDIADEWRWGGSPIPEHSTRREAFNVMLSMPRGSAPAEVVRQAAREFAQREFADHAWVMVLHDHQANPHVHLSVRAQSRHGRRLNPRKADLRRWREVFAERLRARGVEAEATRQATRGVTRNHDALWRLKAKEDGRLRCALPDSRTARTTTAGRTRAIVDWTQLSRQLAMSTDGRDLELARSIDAFVGERQSALPDARSTQERTAGLGAVPARVDKQR
jgi:type IV secretory pathway VirD2 relaxase